MTFFSPLVKPCENKNGGCDQKCVEKAHKAICTCNEGFHLGLDDKSCINKTEKCKSFIAD